MSAFGADMHYSSWEDEPGLGTRRKAADVYITAQVESALIEASSSIGLNLIGNELNDAARRLISALDDRDIELRPR